MTENKDKICFKCGVVKPILDFYKHKAMSDGRLNKCKDCTRKDVAEHRANNIEKIRAYDRERGRYEKRISANSLRCKAFRKKFPEKYFATRTLGNAVRSGAISKKPCAVCGSINRIEAHHFDYSKPLEVIWLCSVHHSAVHYPKLYNVNNNKD